MPTQHVVQFSDSVRLTRMPPGRAEGRIWLHFVATGLGFNDDPRWSLHEHVVVSGKHGTLENLGGGESSDGWVSQLHMELTDDGSQSIKIEYRDNQILDQETVELPEN